MVTLAAHGLSVDVPDGWDARLYRRPAAEPGATTQPVLHAASFPLPEDRGDYGSGAVERMTATDVLVCLLEFDPAAARTPLFAREGFPLPLLPADFGPRRLQRALPGQSGRQFFFSVHGRAFCLYVVLGSHARRAELVPRAATLVERIRVPG